jgi:hypothetical protein
MDQGAKPPNKEEIWAWLRQPDKSRERDTYGSWGRTIGKLWLRTHRR